MNCRVRRASQIFSFTGCIRTSIRSWRTDNCSLLAIRNGERDLGEIIEWSQKEEKEVIKLYEQSAMRASVDMNLVKDLLLQSRKTFYGMEKTHRLNCITTYENRFLQASGGVLQ